MWRFEFNVIFKNKYIRSFSWNNDTIINDKNDNNMRMYIYNERHNINYYVGDTFKNIL